MRILLTCTLLLIATASAIAQARPETVRASDITRGEVTFQRVDYMRELWVGLPADDVNDNRLLRSMRDACDDTTAVAVLNVRLKGSVAATPAERLAVETVAARSALADLKHAVNYDPKVTRLVLVGVLDSCQLAARVAVEKDAGADGLMLIDPAVGDIELPAEGLPNLGVDVLVHPRSNTEWGSHESELVTRLSTWGRSARGIRSTGHFDNLTEHLNEIRRHTRGFTILQQGLESSFTSADIAKKLADYDVVIVGELHGNPGAHRIQLELLRHFATEKRKVALATEQFERDVQPVLDDYLAGKIDEEQFLKKSRPLPNHADYRPLVELCKEKSIPVLAANIPRRLASRVYKETPEVMSKFSEEEKAWSANELKALPGAYRDKFMKTMGGAGGHNANLENMYAAQCIKDDTMAESIANWLKANEGARVLHINGNFHSAGGLGVPEKLTALMPELKVAMVTCIARGEEQEAAGDEWIVTVPAHRPRREK